MAYVICLSSLLIPQVKTRVLRKTTNPVYDETFTFYGIDYNQIQGITLHFVVLSFDRFSRDDIIGEVLYPLAGLELGDQEVSLCKEISPRHIKVGSIKLFYTLCIAHVSIQQKSSKASHSIHNIQVSTEYYWNNDYT